MATATATKPKTVRERKEPPPLHARLKTQLTTAALRSKVTKDQLIEVENHIQKLKALLDA